MEEEAGTPRSHPLPYLITSNRSMITSGGRNPMRYVILDLEWNGTYSKRLDGFFNEIIEFGAVKVDGHMNLLDTFSEVVRPQIGKKLSGKVKRLTNISNEELDLGVPFTKALSQFKLFLGDALLMTWGTSDILALMENSRYYTGQDRIPFLSTYADLQSYCERRLYYEPGKQMGLSTAAQLLGISEEGMEHHRALDDSMLSLECCRRLFDPEAFAPFIQNADIDEFYDRISFKTTILCDLNNPLIDRSQMVFHCDKCGRKAKQRTEWEFKNKSYRAQFECMHCRENFIGRIQFKLKYEGLLVKKKILPLPEKKPGKQEVSSDIGEHTQADAADVL